MKRIAVALSGRGSNFMAIHTALLEGRIENAEIALVFSDKAGAPGLTYARDNGIPAEFHDPKGHADRQAFDDAIAARLDELDIDLVVLAGYMRILSPSFVDAYRGRMINIHPSLLPAFPGLNVQQKAIDHGVRFSGCTVHFVDVEVDAGPIILQAAVPVSQDDTAETLATRILVEEHRIYPEAVNLFTTGRLSIAGRKVFIDRR